MFAGGCGRGGCNKGVVATKGRRALECTVVAEEGNSSVEQETTIGNLCSEGLLMVVNKKDGSKRSLLVALVRAKEDGDGKGDDGSVDGGNDCRWQGPHRCVCSDSEVDER
ncbi:hypothetical protein B296_00006077 [Ensete ventricosum]|uniref:Uncharacterized protein n=1 Tax=Ensete ventricosum TaxID=4639 RepID=A0A427A7R0_ENSVE|nr:hypothetical protein B296_00006077 [Ensete ventricosum]